MASQPGGAGCRYEGGLMDAYGCCHIIQIKLRVCVCVCVCVCEREREREREEASEKDREKAVNTGRKCWIQKCSQVDQHMLDVL